MKTKSLFIILITVLLYGCASTESILAEFDESVDFENYSSFVICLDDLYVENTQDPAYDNNVVRELIANELELQMTERDHETNVFEPELQVGFELIIEKKEAEFVNCEANDDIGYWKECTIDTEIYTEETLVIYVSDFAKNQVIWQASMPCDMSKSKNKLEGYVKSVVEKVFNEYPKAKNKV